MILHSRPFSVLPLLFWRLKSTHSDVLWNWQKSIQDSLGTNHFQILEHQTHSRTVCSAVSATFPQILHRGFDRHFLQNRRSVVGSLSFLRNHKERFKRPSPFLVSINASISLPHYFGLSYWKSCKSHNHLSQVAAKRHCYQLHSKFLKIQS